MIATGFFITCILVIVFSVVRFSLAIWKGDPGYLKWLIPIPVTGMLFLCLLFFSFMFGW
jgi:hypothetical protein